MASLSCVPSRRPAVDQRMGRDRRRYVRLADHRRELPGDWRRLYRERRRKRAGGWAARPANAFLAALDDGAEVDYPDAGLNTSLSAWPVFWKAILAACRHARD